MNKPMKSISAILASVAFLPAVSAAPAHLVLAVAPNLPDRLREPVAVAAGDLLFRSEPGTRVTVLTNGPIGVLTDVRVGDGSLKVRQERVRPQIARTLQGLRAATNAAADFIVPEQLDFVARQLAVSNAAVILVGPARHEDQQQPRFNFTTNWPGDGHLLAGWKQSVFSTVERAHQLDDVTVHWVVTDSDRGASPDQATAVLRFWSLFIGTQNGVLASYSPDLSTALGNALAGRAVPVFNAALDPRDTNLVMHFSALGAVDDVKPVAPPTVATNVVTTTNVITVTNVVTLVRDTVLPSPATGNSLIGIIWSTAPGESQRIDLDLYVRVRRDGTELSFRNTNSLHGRYFRDVRQAQPLTGGNWHALWEAVELTGDGLPPEIWINLYSGRGPVQGEARVQHRGHEYRIAFTFPAVNGNGGGEANRRDRSEHWLRIDLTSITRTP